jgi:hypothetical protein
VALCPSELEQINSQLDAQPNSKRLETTVEAKELYLLAQVAE